MSTTVAAPAADVVVRGVVKNGVVELPPGAFPEGAEVDVVALRVAAPKPAHNFRDAHGGLFTLTAAEIDLVEEHDRVAALSAGRPFVPADPNGPPVDAYGNPVNYTPGELAELAGWDKLGDEAWAMIPGWEQEGNADATR